LQLLFEFSDAIREQVLASLRQTGRRDDRMLGQTAKKEQTNVGNR
jgi:hypothetical protein